MYAVLVHNDQTEVEIDESFLREVVEFTLKSEGIADAEISIAILNDRAIHRINREFLNHDYPTDVISFLLDSDDDSAAGRSIDGEIVISAETARRRSEEFDWSPADEVVYYLVHGLLHLAGYDDRTPEDRIAMRTREQSVLVHWDLHPRYDEPSRIELQAPSRGQPEDRSVSVIRRYHTPGGEP